MIKISLFIFIQLTLISLCGICQIEVEYYDNGNKKVEKNHDENTITKWYKNGQIKSKQLKLSESWYHFLTSNPMKWHENGQLAYEVKILSGDTLAEVKYYPSGQLQCIIKNTFVRHSNDIEMVHSTCYCENGQLSTDAPVFSTSVVEIKTYHCNGSLFRHYHMYRGGIILGDYFEYDEHGNLIVEAYYEDGELDTYKEYDASGKLVKAFTFLEDGEKMEFKE